MWMNWSGVATLEHGGTYAICVTGQYSLPNDSLFFSDGPNSCSAGAMQGKRTSTTIDRSKPVVSIVAAGGAASTTNPAIPVSIGFTDDVAGPSPANFVCVAAGSAPCDSYALSSACSVPAGPGKSTTFTCELDASSLPDGPVTLCVIGADASVPDNPSSADQTRSASQANRSDAQCDTVVLDRPDPPADPPPSGGATGGGGGGGGTGTPGTGTPDPGTPSPGAGAGPLTASGHAAVQIGGVTVLVPKRVRLRMTRQLALRTRTGQAGVLTLRLTRGTKVYSRVTVKLSPGDATHRLRLPKRLRAGNYAVKIAFKAAGTSWWAARAAKVVLRKG